MNADAAADEIDRLRAENARLRTIADTDKASSAEMEGQMAETFDALSAGMKTLSETQEPAIKKALASTLYAQVALLRRLYISPPLQADACKAHKK